MASRNDRLAQLPLWLALAFLSLFVLAPLGVLAWETLWSQDGFTLEAWRALTNDANAKAQLLASLRLGVAATAISALLGGGHAWLTVARDLPGRRPADPAAERPRRGRRRGPVRRLRAS